MRFLMAATVGLLIFLGFDAFFESFEQAEAIPGALQGVGVMVIGIVGSIALLNAIGRIQLNPNLPPRERRSKFATMVAVGMGLHNLGEGLAIGAAFALGEAALGTFLVVGFIIQNITEGLGVVVPLAKQRTGFRFLAILALVAGAPAIIGAWIGGLAIDPIWSMLFLAIGAGAVFQVAWQIGKELVWNDREDRNPMPLTAFSGLMTGMLALFVTGLIIK
jgi:zinc transporter ZupT